MAKLRYAVDSEDGYTHEFVADSANDHDEAKTVARDAVARLFGSARGPYMIWNLEGDQCVQTFNRNECDG